MNEIEAILILVISIGAFLMPLISSRLNLPSPVAEIMFGLLIGLIFKDIIHDTEVVNFIGELGFIILMYLAGLEINFEKIKKLTTKEKNIYITVVLLLVISAIGVVYYLNLKLIYALVILTTAIGLLYPLLKDLGLLSKHFGQSLLIIGSIGEFVSLIAITFFFVIYQYGFSQKAFKHLVEIYLFFLFAYILLRLFKLYIWWNPKKVYTFLKTNDITETSVRANFVNMFIFVALASLLGLEPIIGAFLGGMLFAMVFKDRQHITEKLASFGYGFLIPIFFINVGLKFNLIELLDLNLFLVAIKLSVIILFVRLFSSIILLFANFSLKEVLLTSFALSASLTLLVAIATIGYETKMISEKEASAILLTAIITALVYPWIFKNLVNNLYNTKT